MARPVAVVVLTLVVLGSVVGAVAGPAQAQAGSNVTTATADYTLDQLRPNGQLPANAPPSVRAGGTFSEYSVDSPVIKQKQKTPLSGGFTIRRMGYGDGGI